MKASPVWRVLPLVIILGGFALRLYQLGVSSLWYDETVSIFLARSDPAELLRHTAGDIHPPFYYLLLHAWGQLAGWSEFSAAFLSLWFGVLLIALVNRAGRDWLGKSTHGKHQTAALSAALLVAVSPFNVWYSQEVRMYTLGAVLGLASVLFMRRLGQEASPTNRATAGRPFTREFWAYAVITALGLYTLYYFVFLLLFEWVWLVWRVVRTRSLLRVAVLSQLTIVLLYLPWLPIAIRQATDPPVPPWRSFVALPQVVLEAFGALALGQAVELQTAGALVLLTLGALTAATFWLARTERKTLPAAQARANGATGRRRMVSPWFLLAYFLIPLSAIYLLSLWKPLYHVRYLYIYSPGFYLLVALGVARVIDGIGALQAARRRAAAWGIAAVIMAAGVVFLMAAGYALYNFWHNPAYAKDDLRSAVQYLAERWRPGDVILVNAGYAYPAVVYYFGAPLTRERLTNYHTANATQPLVLQTGSIGGAANLGWGDPRSDFYATTAQETRAALDRVFAAHPRVWMLRIYDTVTDPDGMIRQYLGERGTLLDDRVFTGESQARVQGYLTRALEQLPSSAALTDVMLGDRVKLLGMELPHAVRHAGEPLDVVLYWQLAQPVNVNYQVSVQVLDSSGAVATQYDEMPLGKELPMTRWRVGEVYREPVRVALPAGLAPGEYAVIAKLYNLRDGSVVGEPAQLGAVRVEP